MSTCTSYVIISNAPLTTNGEPGEPIRVATRPTKVEAKGLRDHFHETYPGLTFLVKEEIELGDAGPEDYLRVQSRRLRTDVNTYGQSLYLDIRIVGDHNHHLVDRNTDLAKVLSNGDPGIVFHATDRRGKSVILGSSEDYLKDVRTFLFETVESPRDFDGVMGSLHTQMLQRHERNADQSLFWREEVVVREGLEAIIDELRAKVSAE